MSRSRPSFLFFVVLCFGPTLRADMITRVANPAATDRFYSGSGRAFWAQSLDLSGVGNTGGMSGHGQWATLISPSFFVSATHYAPGGTVTFYDGNSPGATGHSFTIAGGMEIHDPSTPGDHSDLYLGMLSAPVPKSDNIHPYAVVADNETSLKGATIDSVGAPWRVGTNNIGGFTTLSIPGANGPGRSLYYAFDQSPTASPYNDYLQGGDSGGPSFVLNSGQLALVGVHWFITSGGTTKYSGDTYVSHYIRELDAAMTAYGSSDQVTVVNYGSTVQTTTPEPATLTLMLIGGGGLLGVGLRRRLQHIA